MPRWFLELQPTSAGNVFTSWRGCEMACAVKPARTSHYLWSSCDSSRTRLCPYSRCLSMRSIISLPRKPRVILLACVVTFLVLAA